MGRERMKLGKIGEELAFKELQKRGYRILETNFRTVFGELDMIAKIGDTTVFVEIKTRASSSLGPPHLSVTRSKQRHIIKNALSYLKVRGLVDSDWRIDVVSVKMNEAREVEYIEIIENAVEEY
ncbi:MAG: YraN family protein [Candidatus Omnitrophota bacterium]